MFYQKYSTCTLSYKLRKRHVHYYYHQIK